MASIIIVRIFVWLLFPVWIFQFGWSLMWWCDGIPLFPGDTFTWLVWSGVAQCGQSVIRRLPGSRSPQYPGQGKHSLGAAWELYNTTHRSIHETFVVLLESYNGLGLGGGLEGISIGGNYDFRCEFLTPNFFQLLCRCWHKKGISLKNMIFSPSLDVQHLYIIHIHVT